MSDEELLKQAGMMIVKALETDSPEVYDKAVSLSQAASLLVLARNSVPINVSQQAMDSEYLRERFL